jgi:hypothetical protein
VTAPRLRDLVPRAVAAAVLDVVLRHRATVDLTLAPALAPNPDAALATLREQRLDWATLIDGSPAGMALALRAYGLGWRAHEPDLDALAESGLALTAQALATYAQTGAAWDWRGSAEARDAVQTLCAALYPASASIDLDATTGAIGVMLRAACTRAELADGAAVPQRWLAELAGVTDGRVRQVVAAGVLKRKRSAAGTTRSRDRGYVTAASARAWLSAQGVAGYAAAEAAE